MIGSEPSVGRATNSVRMPCWLRTITALPSPAQATKSGCSSETWAKGMDAPPPAGKRCIRLPRAQWIGSSVTSQAIHAPFGE